MAAEQEMWDALFDYLRGMIAELREELAAHAEGAEAARRPYGGAWEDITEARMGHIRRDIERLENALRKHGQRE